MNTTRRFVHVVLVVGMVLGAVNFAAAQSPSDVISIFNGEKITRADLQDQLGGRLLQPRQDLYTAEQKALDELIARKLLAKEAKRQNLTPEELLKRDIYDKIPQSTDQELHVLYEVTNVGGQPFDAVKAKLAEYLHTARQERARLVYLDELRAKADVVVLLAPPRTDVTADNAPSVGPKNASVQLIEYADYECPYCVKVYPTVKKLQQEYGDRVNFVFKNFPLPMHANAQKAAEAALCAAAQNKFLEFHDAMFTSGQLDVSSLKKDAAQLKLDVTKFDLCLDKGTEAAAVQQNLAEAQKLGLTGTPSFFLNGRFFYGAIDYDTLKKMVDQELSSVEKAKDKQSAAVKGAGE